MKTSPTLPLDRAWLEKINPSDASNLFPGTGTLIGMIVSRPDLQTIIVLASGNVPRLRTIKQVDVPEGPRFDIARKAGPKFWIDVDTQMSVIPITWDDHLEFTKHETITSIG